MTDLSVIIITFNEENNIVECIRSARQVSNDIVVVDSGSTDATTFLAAQTGARVFEVSWQGYGHSRNFAAGKALNSWILSLDADERISEDLASSIARLDPEDPQARFRFRRRNFLNAKRIRFGNPGLEQVTRIYNREYTAWDESPVHETLLGSSSKRKSIEGHILHFGLKTSRDYQNKSRKYARMCAEKYFMEGRKTTLIKRLASPIFNSLKSYIFQLGFLDGRNGLIIAITIARYSYLKYYLLHCLNKESENRLPAYRAGVSTAAH